MPSSGIEHERALQRVVAAHVEIDAELVVPGGVARALADIHRRAGDGREDGVGQRRRGTRGVLVRLELGVAGIAYLERSLPALHVELDRDLLNRDDFAHQLDELAERASELA